MKGCQVATQIKRGNVIRARRVTVVFTELVEEQGEVFAVRFDREVGRITFHSQIAKKACNRPLHVCGLASCLALVCFGEGRHMWKQRGLATC